MGGGSKSRTKKKSKSKKKLTSSERQCIYDQIYRQVLSDIQAKKVAEEEEARRLAQEALDKKKTAGPQSKRGSRKGSYAKFTMGHCWCPTRFLLPSRHD
ncbi:hypothetical protein OROHE_009051 [Orobanche hederae]